MVDTTPRLPAAGALAGPRPTSAAVAWLAVAILCVAQIVSTIDRGMLALVIDPVRADLNISEIQIALLQGFAFSIFYVTVGLPLGAVADVVNRRRLLVIGILVWSCATIGGGLAQNFGQMFASRLLIGVGEAVLGPCAVTMISDLFPETGRGRPMAVYVLGSMIAYGIGSLVTGYILQLAPRGAFDALPLIAHLASWRIAFVLVGGFGFVIAGLLLLLREPPRHRPAARAQDASGLRANLAFLARHRAIFLPLYGALACFAMGGSVATGWGAVLLTRTFGLTLGAAGKGLGSAQIAWAMAGALVASVLVDRVARRAGIVGKIRLAAVMALSAIPSAIAIMAPGGKTAILLLAEVTFASAIYGTTMLSVVAELAPMRVRGLCVALYAFVMTMIGASLGPLAVASLTERLFGSPGAVGLSMAIVGAGALCVSAALALVAARQLSAARGEAEMPDGFAIPELLPRAA